MNETEYLILLLTPVVLQLVGSCFAVWSDPYILRRSRRIMLIIIGLVLCLTVQDLSEHWLYVLGIPRGRLILGIVGYSLRPLILLQFILLVSDRDRHWLSWLLVVINALVHLTALFSDLCFSIDASNVFTRGPLGYTCHAVSGILLAELVCLSVKRVSKERGIQVWIPVFNAALIVCSVLADSFVNFSQSPLSFLTLCVVSASLFYYIWLHLQFAREHERDLRTEQRVRIMLCDSDPGMAKEATVIFSRYLRGNMRSLTAEGLIPFEKELEHTRLYLDLEQLRFEDALRVDYEIRCVEFSIPALTLEPIVENAVRHGVRGNPNGHGTVTISTRETEDAYIVAVSDNGPGFDPELIEKADESHVGIRNVRGRLESVCGGALVVDSEVGKGTTVTILLPKGEGTASC